MDIEVRELYRALCCKSKRQTQFFGRNIYFLLLDDFIGFEQYFTNSRNILNRHINLRTKHHFTHIHAIKSGECISFHIDYANPDKNLVFVFVHFLVDVIPYFSYRLLRFHKMYK
ncbi:MAG: hypothetical protein AUK16_01805 [Parcubacteria group bacterium CG2_30_44_11]|nr:MAG: hypothetical protein AUK16_01805 [Parcubacteria group bacterium CG2_30_44_11]